MSPTLNVGRVFEFSSSHWLPEHPHCGLSHGHNYRMEVEVSGPVNKGMIIDFALLKVIVENRLEGIDHRCLNNTLDYPSVENLITLLWNRIQEGLDSSSRGIKLVRLKIWETSNCYAELVGE